MERLDSQTDGWTDGWMDKDIQTDRQTDRHLTLLQGLQTFDQTNMKGTTIKMCLMKQTILMESIEC